MKAAEVCFIGSVVDISLLLANISEIFFVLFQLLH